MAIPLVPRLRTLKSLAPSVILVINPWVSDRSDWFDLMRWSTQHLSLMENPCQVLVPSKPAELASGAVVSFGRLRSARILRYFAIPSGGNE